MAAVALISSPIMAYNYTRKGDASLGLSLGQTPWSCPRPLATYVPAATNQSNAPAVPPQAGPSTTPVPSQGNPFGVWSERIQSVAEVSIHEAASESYKVTLICKDEKRSRPPFSCKQPNCEQFCDKLHPKGWGKCQDDNQFVCQCFHICYKDVPVKVGLKADTASSQPSRRP
ncbi:hypothetical protein Vadar_028948 [Vaccinium darrowii]|uniref:Uncharacterized protein n=1 Tax=Vaccinium darrowii TaxID=229202 RepID=A0ACB7Z6Z2_9ERIC|nr:hypothetical protein Vadar_028948 [Vaccinium darrowii]